MQTVIILILALISAWLALRWRRAATHESKLRRALAVVVGSGVRAVDGESGRLQLLWSASVHEAVVKHAAKVLQELYGLDQSVPRK